MGKKKTTKEDKPFDKLEFIQEILGRDLVGEEKTRLTLFLISISAKLLEKPLGAVILSVSSAGKSTLIEEVTKRFPRAIDYEYDYENNTRYPIFSKGFGVIKLNELTSAALFRISFKDPYFFENKLIIIPELPENPSEDQVRVNQLIRQLISEGEINKMMFSKKEDQPYLLTLYGYPGFISADANFKVEEQLANRILLLTCDETSEQTKKIAIKQGKEHEEPWGCKPDEEKEEKLNEIVNGLKYHDKVKAFNPWGTDVSNYIFTRYGQNIQTRRLNNITLRFIDVITLLNQENHEVYKHIEDDNILYVKVENEDVEFAFNFLNGVLDQTIFRFYASSFIYLEEIKQNFPPVKMLGDNEVENWFSVKDLTNVTGKHRNTLYPHLKTLVNAGFLAWDSDRKPHKYRLLNSEEDSLSFTKCKEELPLGEKEVPECLVSHSRCTTNIPKLDTLVGNRASQTGQAPPTSEEKEEQRTHTVIKSDKSVELLEKLLNYIEKNQPVKPVDMFKQFAKDTKNFPIVKALLKQSLKEGILYKDPKGGLCKK